jgi:hypothetical protein
MIIKKKDGTPFANERAAKLREGSLKIEGSKVVEVDDGWGIEVPDTEPEEAVETPVVEFTGTWEPAKLLSLIDKYRVPGRRYKWVNTAVDGGVGKKIAEGFVIDRDMYKNMRNLQVGGDSPTSDGTTTRIRELILMWIPEKVAEQRNKYYRDLANNRAAQDTKKLKADLAEGGGGMYGSLNVQ